MFSFYYFANLFFNFFDFLEKRKKYNICISISFTNKHSYFKINFLNIEVVFILILFLY